MKDFTIFRTGSQRGVNTFMSGEGAIEHPMSTHSAPFGTSWKARGWRYIVSTLMILTLCVGNAIVGGSTANAATCYYTVEIRAICETGASGYVNVKSGKQSATTLSSSLTTNINGCTNITASLNSTRATSSDISVTFYAKPGSGSVVEGWYSDENGQNELVLNGNATPYISELIDQFSINVNNVYAGAGRAIKFKTSKYYEANVKGYDANHRSIITVYVKFAKEATGNKFKPQLTATSSNFSQGHIAISMTSTGSLSKVAQTAGPVDYTLTVKTSMSQTFSVRAQPMRGYKFVNWTVAGTPRTTDKESSTLPLESFTVTLTDEMTPGANDVISNNDVVTANFVADELKDFKIQKEANVGTVSGSYSYYYLISGGNSTTHSDDISSMNLSDTEKSYQLYGTDQITLTATPAPGFLFSGWYARGANWEMRPDSLMTNDHTVVFSLTEDNMTIIPMFALDKTQLIIGEDDNFLVGYSTCKTLEQAISAATLSQHKTILQLKDYTVQPGTYSIPDGVTLLIPHNAAQSLAYPSIERTESQESPTGGAYCTLTLESGARLDVYGTIEVGGIQSSDTLDAGGEDGIGVPSGATYGELYMKANSSIILNDGALLRAWGFVLGDYIKKNGQTVYQCEIDVRSGAKVKEQFQIMDWKGGDNTYRMFGSHNSAPGVMRVLPVNQYFIQNIEVPTKYRPGAKLSAVASVNLYMQSLVDKSDGFFKNPKIGIINLDDAGIIGVKYANKQDAAIFLMDDTDASEDTWVRKFYDPETDQQVYEINNSAYLGSLVLTLFGMSADSREYKLPITNNFKIHLLYGAMHVTQSTEFLPGSVVEIDKEGTLTIDANQKVWFWDSEQWGAFVSKQRLQDGNYTMGYASIVKWRPMARPTKRDVSSAAKLGDAQLIIHGTVDVQGDLKTTCAAGYAGGGAKIISTVEDAGTILFSKTVPANSASDVIWQIKSTTHLGSKDTPSWQSTLCTPAKLNNNNPNNPSDVVETAGKGAGTSYCYMDLDGDGQGAWEHLTVDPDDNCFVTKDLKYYIKPAEYVAVQATKDGSGFFHGDDEHHTFLSEDGSRTFIRVAGDYCQWWEVVYVDENLYRCDHPDHPTYYYWDENDGWQEKKFKVSWVNWDGSPVNYWPLDGRTGHPEDSVNYYMVTYNTIPEWLSANPTRTHDASHEYTFDGWMPTPAAVTKDVTYMATFKERDRMYAITFNDGAAVDPKLYQVLYCKLGEMPVCDKHELEANQEWQARDGSPLGAVSKDETYHPVAKNVDGPFTIKFVNWDGEELLAYDQEEGENAKIIAGNTPAYNGATPIKPADNSHAYTFVGWTPSIGPATQNITYTAKYEVEQITGLNVNTASTLTSDMTVPEVRITTTGSLNITSTAVLTTTNLILEATSDASGQLVAAAENKIDATNVYFDWKPNGETGTASRTWYAIAVPWEVDAENGIFLKETGRTLRIGVDFDLIYYSGSERASVGNKPSCWKYVQHDANKTMRPGRLYMMYFDPGFKTIRFAKKTGSAVLYMDPVNVSTYTEETGNSGIDANWNGIANPKTYYASLSAGSATYAQVLKNGSLDDYFADPEVVYQTINLASSKFTVGKPLFVQATEATSVVVTKQEAAGIVNAAPRRRAAAAELPKGIDAVYRLAIAGEDQPEADNLFVQVAEDEKADRYTIGQDLVKGGVASGRAQVWVNRYDAKLSVNTQSLSNDEAIYPLSIQIPSNGEYTLSIGAVENDEYALYLTRNGEAIWNLSDGDYLGSFEKGTTSEYGLRVSAKSPQIATGIDEAVVDAKGETRKVMINDKVFIIRGENVYSVDGQLVK